jgi:predicted Fe-Mo cluster-binding NifX family protein
MRVCIPTSDDAGLNGRLSQHFGRCAYFTLVDVETGRVEILPNARSHHESGNCGGALDQLAGGAVDAVICRGLGHRALERLRSQGLTAYTTGAWGVAEAVRELRTGRLSAFPEEETCRHGDDHSDHSHGCHHHGEQVPTGQ